MRRPNRPPSPSFAGPRSPAALAGCALACALLACSAAGKSEDAATTPMGAPAARVSGFVSPPPPVAPAAATVDADGPASVTMATDSASVSEPSARPGAASAAASAAMIIRTGTATVEVDSLGAAIGRVRELARRVGGYVANTSLQAGHDQVRTATLEIKVPAARYPEAVDGLRSFGRVEAVNETAEDVGEEFVDVNARIANSRREEARLVELLATRTGRLADVLTVEHELARVREDVERYEGRSRFLATRAAVSTLTVTVHEPAPVIARESGRNPITVAFRSASQNFISFVAAFIASLGVLLPLAALGGALWWGVSQLVDRARAKGTDATGPSLGGG